MIAEAVIRLGQPQHGRRRAVLGNDVHFEADRRIVVETVDSLQARRDARTRIGHARVSHALDLGERCLETLGQPLVERVLGGFYRLQRAEVLRIRSLRRVEVLGVVASELIGQPTATCRHRGVLLLSSLLFLTEAPLRRDIMDTDQAAQRVPVDRPRTARKDLRTRQRLCGGDKLTRIQGIGPNGEVRGQTFTQEIDQTLGPDRQLRRSGGWISVRILRRGGRGGNGQAQ